MKISNELIRTLNPCYDPSKVVADENEELSPLEWVVKYRGSLPDEDIVWLLCHTEFISERNLRLFAVWCGREALKLVKKPDQRTIEALNVAERYANGQATDEELNVAYADACAAYRAAADAARAAAYYAARAARAAENAAGYAAACVAGYAADAARGAARALAGATYDSAHAAQVEKLIEILKEEQK